jgi:membrane associated rhomboid family serine protease
MSDKNPEYFAKHEEQAFLLKAFFTILAIILMREFLSSLIVLAVILFPFLFLLYVRYEAATSGRGTFEILKEHITFMPIMYADGERKKETIPLTTYTLILANIVVFYVFELNPFVNFQFILDNLIFVPHKPNFFNIPLSAFTSLFLHGSGAHLWGNMLFLWVVGTVVERRIGSRRLLLLYLITGLMATFSFTLINFLATGTPGHILGASGSIAGIMGIFAVRCYFKSMVFPLPILGIFSLILPISFKVRLNSLVIIGLFFFMDLSGGIGQITGQNVSNVGHWAHIGGMLAGIGLAFFLKLGEGAIEERHLEIGAKAAGSSVGYGAGEHSLRIALEKNPENAEAYLHLARIKSKFHPTEEGSNAYRKAIKLLIAASPLQAAEIYQEYYKKYMTVVEPDLLYRLAGIYYRQKDLDRAARCLESIVNTKDAPADISERALFQYASILDEMGLTEVARDFFKQYLSIFPESMAIAKVKLKLGIS